MTCRRETPRVGVFLPLAGLDWDALRARAAVVERLGFEALWLDDHFWFPTRPDEAHLDALTALAGLAVATERLLLGPLVLCQSYRSPALLAKMAASLAQMSGDRLVLGLGAGWMEEEYRAYGYPFPPPRARLDQLDEAVQIVRRMLTDARATFTGAHYGVCEAPQLPKPTCLPLLLGGASERLLRVVARHADGWNCPNPAWRDLPARRARLLELCAEVGRDPAEVEVSEQVMVVLVSREAEIPAARERIGRELAGFVKLDGDVHIGTGEMVADALRARAALGVQRFMVMFGDFGSVEQIEAFAAGVLPGLAT
ncbi:MAG: LLM class flavin-dependent oxidoreductase [Deltaproteobacteria bacterium]|nr:LLM class flavin-dependent oxidoreductase [Deltaproteobacteria bacterium]